MKFDPTTVVLGILAAVTALLTFCLSIIELNDQRKRIFGFRVKDIKRYAAILSLLLTMSTYMFQTYKEMEANQKEMAYQRKENQKQIERDDLARKHFLITLKGNDTIVDKLKSDLILARQTLKVQNEILKKQLSLFRQSERMLMPLKEVYFSFSLTYDFADSIFPEYYELLENIHDKQEDCNKYNYLRCYGDRISICLTNSEIEKRFLPSEDRLQKVNATIKFENYDRKDKRDIDIDLGYKLSAWMNGYNIQRYYGYSPKIEQPYEETFYEIIINFEKRTLTQVVERASYQKFDKTFTISSLSDIFYPNDPQKKFIVFVPPYYRAIKYSPRLTNLKVHFGEYSKGILIPESTLDFKTHDLYPDEYRVNIRSLQKYFYKHGYDKEIPGHDLQRKSAI